METNWFKNVLWIIGVVILLSVFVSCGAPVVVADNQSIATSYNNKVVTYSLPRYEANLDKVSGNKKVELDYSNKDRVYLSIDIPVELQQITGIGSPALVFGVDGEPVSIMNNPKSLPLSWKELQEFLKNDSTDSIAYIEKEFACTDYARMVHDNAEEQGIKCGVAAIIVEYGEGKYISHAWNVFPIQGSKSFVFIDCSNFSSYSESVGWYGDTVVIYNDSNKTYHMELLFRDGKESTGTRYNNYRIVAMKVNW